MTDIRPAKRQRVSPSKGPSFNDENAGNEVEVDRKAQAMMDALLAGIDASAFDDILTSPLKSQQSQRPLSQCSTIPRSPLGTIRTNQIAAARQATYGLNSIIKRDRIIQSQLKKDNKAQSPQSDRCLTKMARPEPGIQGRSQVNEEYSFDFDLSDLSAFDDDLLPVKAEPAKTLYPILNPDVPPPPPGYASTPWLRCRVLHVFEGLRFESGIFPSLENLTSMIVHSDASIYPAGKTVIISSKSLPPDEKLILHLKQQWSRTPILPNHKINIIHTSLSQSPTPQPIIFDLKSSSNFIVLHPDLMLTMTSIASAMPCPRRPILNSLIKSSGPTTKNMLHGNILHSLLQGALSDQEFSIEETDKRLKDDLKQEGRRMEIWGAGMSIDDVEEDLGKRAGVGFETFGKKWICREPMAEGDLHSMPGDATSLLSISGLHDIEEDIWSPKWGLKGKVDASVQAKIIKDKKQWKHVIEENIAPLEIKTGRSVGVMAHRAQTMLYTLLMEDRYGVPVPAGLLYYLQLDTILRVEARANEIRALIMTRNELASYLYKHRKLQAPAPISSDDLEPDLTDMEDTFLPPTIDSAEECKNCYAVDSCMLYRKTVDQATVTEDDPIATLYEEKMGHMTGNDMIFFKKWENLLTIEEQDTGRMRKDLWTKTALEREKSGRCFANMIIHSYSNDLGKSLAKIHRHSYTFIRSSMTSNSQPTTPSQAHNQSLLSGHMAIGDPVNISIEPDLLCLSRGFIIDLTADKVTVGVSYVIDPSKLLSRTRYKKLSTGSTADDEGVVFRIDKDEMTSGSMRMRNNLAQLFYAGGDDKRRRLIVDLQKPQFGPASTLRPHEIPNNLNEDQIKAMDNVLQAQDYSLILGMPGTGKTTTIAEIIKVLVERGKSVLLASYTHSAVDNILVKLVNESFGKLRLGNIDKVHPDVQHLTLEAMNESTSIGQLEERLMGPPVVACTCLAIDHPLFHRRKFDYCIIDEASQITLPTILGPLRYADKFVLVGDHYQLPPIVRNPQAKSGGLDVSLFKMLSERYPDSVSSLSYQYRMNEDIMSLSNTLVYEGRLKVGNESVGKRGLRLKNEVKCGEVRNEEDGDTCWIQDLLKEEVKAVFVDTDNLPAKDMKVGDLIQNPKEALLVKQFAQALLFGGIRQEDIAIITPYRQQIKLLSGIIKPKDGQCKIEILTADKSQGRDKDVILISLVRSNDLGNIGDLLKDWRRINVSFTRAKKKLVIFGSRKTLSGDPLLSSFIDLMSGKGWIYTLPKGAERSHQGVKS